MEFESLRRTNYPDSPGRTHTDQDHFRDFRDFHLPLSRLQHAHLHVSGIIRGLEVRGALGGNTLTVQPGVAVDERGQLMVLAQEAPLLTSNFLNSELYVTLKFAEAAVGGRLEQVPEVRLQTVSVVEGGSDEALVVLAIAATDGSGRVAALEAQRSGRQFRRQLIGARGEGLEVQRAARIGDRLEAVTAGRVGAGESGGLRITVPTSGDEVLVARDDGGAFGTFEMRASKVVMPNNVGMGTSTPTQPLEVIGTVKATAFEGDGAALTDVRDPTKVAKDGDIMTGPLTITAADTGLSLTNNAVVGGTLSITGSVGIGTAAPASKLTVQDAAHINVLIDRTDTQDHMTLSVGSGGTGIHFSNSNRFFISADPYSQRTTQGFGNEVFTILSTGNVGIGTTNPGAPLHVAQFIAVGPFSATTGQGGIDVTGPAAEFSFVRRTLTAWPAGPGAGDRFVWYNPDGTARLWTEQRGDLLTVTNAGNVGVGTTAPRTQLHVIGRISTGIDFSSAGAVTFFPPDGFAWFHIDNGPAGGRSIGRLRISHGNSPGTFEIINVLQNGRVGIGTNSPNFTLDVRGTIGNNTTQHHSDRRWKKNVEGISQALDMVVKLRGVRYEWKVEEYEEMRFDQGIHIGLIGQEVEQVIPEVVHTDEHGYKTIEYANLIAVCIEAIKALKAEHDVLTRRLQILEARRGVLT
jgi:hypothetical protein